MQGSKGTSQTTTAQQSVTKPYEPAVPGVNSLLDAATAQIPNAGLTSTENTALTGITNNAANAGQYAPQINALAGDLFAGGTDRTGMVQKAYDQYRVGMTPYANMDTNPYSNEAFTKAAGYMSDDILNRVKSQYASSGYSGAGVGDFGKQVGEGVARGVAPAWAQAYNDNEGRKLGAISGMYGAGNTSAGILGGMDQTALGNRATGVDVSNAATASSNASYMKMLEAEAMRRGIPIQNLAQVANLMIPMARLGQTSNTNGTSMQEITPPAPSPFQTIAGLGIAGIGAASGAGPAAGLFGSAGGLFGGGNKSPYGTNPFTPYGTTNPYYG